jgi:hypothetical protein
MNDMSNQLDQPVTVRQLKSAFDQQNDQLNVSLAHFFGKFVRHIDEYFDKIEARLDDRLNKQDIMIDSLAARITTDEQERAAMNSQLDRHQGWIDQLSKPTKLVPEL